MNIFVSDSHPTIAAINLDDKRLVKMVLETAQLLSTAIRLNGGTATYKATHVKHPATIWVSASRQNYKWLLEHFTSLLSEYTYRYNKEHSCSRLLTELVNGANYIPDNGLQPFANCTTNKGKNISFKHIPDAVMAYREYLKARWQTDTRQPKWTNRTKPNWYGV